MTRKTVTVFSATGQPDGMPLWANWNGLHLPQFQGTPLEQLFADYIEQFTAELQKAVG